MSDTNRLLNETRDKLSETILCSQNIRVKTWPANMSPYLTFLVSGDLKTSIVIEQIHKFINSTNLLSQTVDFMNATMRSIKDVLESFKAIFQPSSIKETGQQLITRAHDILQNMNGSLQLISAVARNANDNVKIIPLDVDVHGFNESIVVAFNNTNSLLSDQGLMQSLNSTLPHIHQVDVILLHITEYLIAPK